MHKTSTMLRPTGPLLCVAVQVKLGWEGEEKEEGWKLAGRQRQGHVPSGDGRQQQLHGAPRYIACPDAHLKS